MLNKDLLINFSSYLIYFIPLALLTGPALPDIIVSTISLIFIYFLILEKKFYYLSNPIIKILFLFYFYLLFSSLVSENIYFSLKSSLFYFRFILFALAVWFLIDNKKNFIQTFNNYLIISFLIALSAGTYEYIFSETIFGKQSISNRLLLLTSDNLLLGQYLSRMFPLIIAFFVYQNSYNKFSYIFLFFIFISTDVLTFLSGERTALGLLFLSSIFILLLIKKLRLFRFLTIIASIIVIVLITSFNSTIKERNIDHTLNQLGISSNSDKIHIFSEKHENYYLTSWKMFIKNPITGIGPNNFRIECKKTEYESELDPCSTHPHNNYFQLLAELGAIGLILIFIIIYYFSKTILNQIYARLANKNFLSDYQICLFACILCSVWPFLPTMNLFNNWINIIYFLPIGFLLHTIYGKDNRTE